MPRGGARPGAGRKMGSRNTPKLQLTSEEVSLERKPTPAERMRMLKRQVALRVSDGMSKETIASIMGIPVDRLEKIFAHELQHGREIIRGEMLDNLAAGGDAGSVSAARALSGITAIPLHAPSSAAAAGKSGGYVRKRDIRLAAADAAGRNSVWGDDLDGPAAIPKDTLQ